MADSNGYLTLGEAAKILHVSPAWLYKRVKKGEIPHRRIGRMIRFHRKDIDELMDAHKTGKAGK
jgi:excisionase family DNA binding protein